MKKLFLILLIFFFLGRGSASASASELEAWWEEETDLGNSGETLDEIVEEGDYIGTVYLEGEFLDGDILKISAFVEDFNVPILGMAFHLPYEGDALTFLKYEPGDFLEKGGDPFYMVSIDEIEKKVVFGETLRRDDNFPVGGGRIVDFYFQILEEGSHFFEFVNGVVSSLEVVRQDLDPVEWQDLSIARSDDYELVLGITGDDYSNSNTSGNIGKYNFENLFIMACLLLFFIASIVIVVKKYRRKLQRPYVNFK